MSFNAYWQAAQQRRAVAEAIQQIQPGDTQAHQRMYQALQQAALLLPIVQVPEGLESGDYLKGENVSVQVKMVKGPQDKIYLPLFTSSAAMQQAHGEQQPHLLLTFHTLVQMVLRAQAGGIILDRQGPRSMVVELAVLLNLTNPRANLANPPLDLTTTQGPSASPSPSTPPNRDSAAPPTVPGQAVTAMPPMGAATSIPTAPTLRVGPPPRVLTFHELQGLQAWLGEQEEVVEAYLFGLLKDDTQPILALGLGFATIPPTAQLQAMARSLRGVLGTSGLIPLTTQLATLLARQPGAIRFELLDTPPSMGQERDPAL